ncbi:uncharacterized protein LOC128991154 [Macrosteles quadrilineatus]|uniref:uncharacterized protein LOC128991154 n=1 Tax=Macrosteles quadrilineatus TaxID=74068 RepID=UPI0023E0DFE3|nr:uncharacterized protein LOC128991154 [Macrosteles quadrilineatus]
MKMSSVLSLLLIKILFTLTPQLSSCDQYKKGTPIEDSTLVNALTTGQLLAQLGKKKVQQLNALGNGDVEDSALIKNTIETSVLLVTFGKQVIKELRSLSEDQGQSSVFSGEMNPNPTNINSQSFQTPPPPINPIIDATSINHNNQATNPTQPSNRPPSNTLTFTQSLVTDELSHHPNVQQVPLVLQNLQLINVTPPSITKPPYKGTFNPLAIALQNKAKSI